MNDPRYPIGKFQAPVRYDASGRATSIDAVAAVPSALRAAMQGLTAAQLDTPYRDGGWTVRQLVHHVADSHINAFIRFKLALTESEPTITAYDENLWARLPDVQGTPVEVSLSLVDALHARWVVLLRAMQEAEFARAFKHPERGLMTLDHTLAMYSWHGQHHVAHITELKKQKGWK